MKGNCTYLPYAETGFFSKIVIDYLNEEEQLISFYKHLPTLTGIEDAIKERQKFPQQRNVLLNELKKQYQNISLTDAVSENIESLSHETTFTITTAHQPNIFTGPLYFIYKILHAIKLAQNLKEALPAYNFVPVYYMGSEDADLEEIGTTFINGEKYQWQTKQTGAVGRMKIDKPFMALIEKMQGQLVNETHGEEIIKLFRSYYSEGTTLQEATLAVVNELFGEYGLVVLIPDNTNLKKLFSGIIKKELEEQFSHKEVNATTEALRQYYKPQAGGRDLNLFYLIDDKRERIEKEKDKYSVHSLSLSFTREEILNELEEHPERFSPNVILRGVFQETILPNIAFIGGGGEIAYWLELKKVFEVAHGLYPLLLLRNSFLLINVKQQEKIKKLGFEPKDFFKDELFLIDEIIKRSSSEDLSLEKYEEQVRAFYRTIQLIAGNADNTLQQHVEALQTNALKKLIELEKKMARATRRKFDAEQKQIEKLKSQLFPSKGLQERTENIAGFYARFGKDLISLLLKNSLSLEQQFAILDI